MTSPALAWDELLSTLTPADAEVIRSVMPVALRDQIDAAATAALFATMSEMEAHGAGPPRGLTHGDIPGWLRLSILDALAQFMAGSASTCLHAPTPDRPEPVYAAAWRPGLVVCGECLHLFRLAGAADRTCDCCGQVCDGIHAARLLFGPLVYMYGTCAGCLTEGIAP